MLRLDLYLIRVQRRLRMTVPCRLTKLHSFAQQNMTRTVYYPCLCLCFGFSQITLIFPFLLMILHFSQIGFTEDLTFTSATSFQKSPTIMIPQILVLCKKNFTYFRTYFCVSLHQIRDKKRGYRPRFFHKS